MRVLPNGVGLVTIPHCTKLSIAPTWLFPPLGLKLAGATKTVFHSSCRPFPARHARLRIARSIGAGDVTGLGIAGVGIGGEALTGLFVTGLGIGGGQLTGIGIAGQGMGAEDVTGITIAGFGMGASDGASGLARAAAITSAA